MLNFAASILTENRHELYIVYHIAFYCCGSGGLYSDLLHTQGQERSGGQMT